ncbi:unnamed protein product, partial [Sphacelaria rigidula]
VSLCESAVCGGDSWTNCQSAEIFWGGNGWYFPRVVINLQNAVRVVPLHHLYFFQVNIDADSAARGQRVDGTLFIPREKLDEFGEKNNPVDDDPNPSTVRVVVHRNHGYFFGVYLVPIQ